MTDETRVLRQAVNVAMLEDDIDWPPTALDLIHGEGYSIVPTATLERARRIEARAFRETCIAEAERLADDWNLSKDERNRVVGFATGLAPRLRAALSDGGES